MTPPAPAVSVITPLFNGAAFIAETIASVQDQSLGDYEHLVIDNRSSDNGPQIAAAAAAGDARIRLLSQPDSPGAGPTRNAGIAAARGRYIAFLDCDDLWHRDKLARQIAAMRTAGAAFSWAGYEVIDAAGQPLRRQSAVETGGAADLLNRRMTIGCLTAVYDRQLLGRMLMTYPAPPEDFCLWMDILIACAARGLPVVGLPEPLASYRVHGGGTSAGKLRAARAYWRACRRHLGLSRLRTARHFAQYAGQSLAARI